MTAPESGSQPPQDPHTGAAPDQPTAPTGQPAQPAPAPSPAQPAPAWKPAQQSPAPSPAQPAPSPAQAAPAPAWNPAQQSPAQGQPVQGQPAQGQPAQGQPAQGWSPAQPGSAPSPAQPVPGAPAPAAGMTPQELKQKLTGVGLVNPLPTLAVGGATYVAGLALAILTVALVAVAAMIASIGNPVETALEQADLSPTDPLSGIGTAIRFPFQLVAMAMFGSIGFRATYEGQTVQAAVRSLPAVITLVMVLVSFFGGRFVQKRQAARQAGIWTSAVLTGLVVSLVTVLAALIFAQRIPVTDDFALRLHAAGADSFFGAFFLITLAIALGRISVTARPAWWPLVTDLFSGLKLGLVHALIVTVLGFLGIAVVSTVKALADGETPPVIYLLLLLPLIGGGLLAYLPGGTMLSSVTFSMRGEALGFLGGMGTQSSSMFSLDWYVWLAGLLLGGIGLVLASLLWQHRRVVVPNNVIALAVSWGALPIAYFVGSLGLLIFARLSLGASYSGSLGDAEIVRISAGLAAWTPLLALLAGVIVELLSRFAAPLVAGVIPTALLGWFRRPLSPALVAPAAAASAATPAAASAANGTNGAPAALAGDQATAPTADAAPATGAPAANPYAPVQIGATGAALATPGAQAPAVDPATGQAVAAPATPVSPRTKKLMIGGGIGLGALFVLVIGGAIAFNVVSSTVFSPEKKVEAYLSAMQDGKASAMREISAPNAPTAQQALLTDEIAGAAENRISGYEIVSSEKSGDDAVVTAKLTQDGVTSTRTFLVERSGRTAVLFPNWKMGTTDYAYVNIGIPEGATTLLVNGQEVAVETLDTEYGYVTAAVVPGTYEVSLPAVSDFVAAEPVSVAVPADTEEWFDLIAEPVYALTDAGNTEVQTQVNAAVDTCASSKDARPADCMFGVYTYSLVEGSGSWKVDTYPTLTVEPSGTGWGFYTDYTAEGAATYSYQEKGWDDEITDETSEDTFSVSGSVTVNDDGTLAVELDNY